MLAYFNFLLVPRTIPVEIFDLIGYQWLKQITTITSTVDDYLMISLWLLWLKIMIKNWKLVIWQRKIDVMVSVSNLKKKMQYALFTWLLHSVFKEEQKCSKNARDIRKIQGWHFVLFKIVQKTFINPLEKLVLEALTCFYSCT